MEKHTKKFNWFLEAAIVYPKDGAKANCDDGSQLLLWEESLMKDKKIGKNKKCIKNEASSSSQEAVGAESI